MTDIIDKTRTVLEEAEDIVNKRGTDYGSPAVNHGRTAAMWSAYLGVEITPRDVCMLNVLQKVSRYRYRPIRDSLTDVAGYVRNIEMMDET